MISVAKRGEKVDLTKTNPGLTTLEVGVGWNPEGVNGLAAEHPITTAPKQRGELLESLGDIFTGRTKVSKAIDNMLGNNVDSEIDIDASVIMLKDDKLVSDSDIISYNRKNSKCGGVSHSGDDVAGGSGRSGVPDEVINVDLSKIPAEVNRLIFIANLYDSEAKKQHFGMVPNAFIRISDGKTKTGLIQYDFTDDYNGCTAIYLCELYRDNNEWIFASLGEGTTDKTIEDAVKRYR